MTQAHETDLTDLIYEMTSAEDIYFSARMSGLYRSDDRGASWQSVYESLGLSEPLPTVTAAVPPNFQREPAIFAGVNGGILRSPDGGQQWQKAYFPTPPATISTLKISPGYVEDGTIFAGTLEDGIFFSRDRGQTWAAGNFGLLDLSVYALAVSPGYTQDATLYAGTQTGVFRSTNGGRSWKEVELPADYDAILSLALSPEYHHDGTLFAGTETRGLLRSNDGGSHWVNVAESLAEDAVNAVLLSSRYPKQPEVLILHGDILKFSADDGQTWQLWNEEQLAGKSVSAIHAPHGFEGGATVFVGLQDGGIMALQG